MSTKIRAAIALTIVVLASVVAVGSAAAKDGKPILKPIKLQEHSSFEFRTTAP
jgi:hypothetical protein